MGSTPEGLRASLAAYVAAMHRAYLDGATDTTPAEKARLPLCREPFTVAVVGTRHLHVIGLVDRLPEPTGQEVVIEDSLPDMHWSVRFFDPVVLPSLAAITEPDGPDPQSVRDALGISSVLYHLALPPGSGLTAHHALHAGTGLVHAHLVRDREYGRIREAFPDHVRVVAQMRSADEIGLDIATAALAQVLIDAREGDTRLLFEETSSEDARKAVLARIGRPA